MIINRVTIQNFFCYLGDDNVFEFSKGLNIISAPNGAGKSQLFNTFYWTFFDKVYIDKDGQPGKKEWRNAINTSTCPDKLVLEASDGDKIISSVEIILTSNFHENLEIEDDEDQVKYTFFKSIEYKKSGSEIVIISKPELVISYELSGETEFIPSHLQNSFLGRIFPESIRKFMWYQGETMDNLYDFGNNITLRNAINEISYYPMYDVMDKIVQASSKSIDDKIEKELGKQNKIGKQEQELFKDISDTIRNIESKESNIEKIQAEITNLEEEIAIVEDKLKGFDEFLKIKTEMVKYEGELENTKQKLESLDVLTKESLINKWMLNGCEHLIQAAVPNLELINLEIQKFQQVVNPVPYSLPGPEYIVKMLADHTCYICEREVEENTEPYFALKRRLNDFEENIANKLLQDNYTDLNRARARLIKELPGIAAEIRTSSEDRSALIKKRNLTQKKLRNIFEEVGEDQRVNIIKGAVNASQLVSKLQTLKQAISTKNKSRDYVNLEIQKLKGSLRELQSQKDAIVKKSDTNLIETVAADYIKMFVKSIGKLRGIAYDRLIEEIQNESNRLYSLYLGGKQQGRIEIGDGIRIVDEKTKDVLTNLNTGELVAQKLAVANSFLSLSSKKMNRSYPVIADAPTSELDSDNTYNLTLNIGKSFEQIIIMSKDYVSLPDDKIKSLIQEAGIAKYYKIENGLIDVDGVNSRTNKKSNIIPIK
jgi:DNA sulfur modification protein DndD